MRKLATAAVLVIACSLAAAPAAGASRVSQVLADCNAHGRLTRTYALADLRAALATMPADMKEYTNCSDVIQGALLGKVGASHGGPGASGGSGSSFLPAWLIVVLVLLALAGLTLGAAAVRRRRTT